MKYSHAPAIVVFSILLGLSSAYSQRRASGGTTKTNALTPEQIAKAVLPSVVLIVCEDGNGTVSLASGFFVNGKSDGTVGAAPGPLVVTNYHVIKGMIRGVAKIATGRGRQIWRIAEVRNYDADSDLALLSLDARGVALTPLVFASSPSLRVGQTVYAFGNPEGLIGTMSQGIVSSAPRKFEEGTRLQLSAPISAGSSGGPVVDSTGTVIGVVEGTFKEGQNLNFAIPTSSLRLLVDRTPYVPRFDEWAAASQRRKSEQDWIWLAPNPELDELYDRSSASAPTTRPKTEKSEPTLEETSSWLKDKLEGLSANLSDGWRARVEQFNVEGGISYCSINLTVSGEKEGTKIISKYAPSLSLAEKSFAAQNTAGDWAAWISFSKNIFEFSETYDAGRFIHRREERKSKLAVFTGDEELATRMANAFDHLIKLCGGGPRKEPF